MSDKQPRQSRGTPSGGRFAQKLNPEADIELDPDTHAPSATQNPSPVLSKVFESAAALQEVIPDATLVGGSAAAFYAGHRDSYDHDHVLADLADHYDMVLEAVESQDSWVTNRMVARKLILGDLGDIEAGVRQLIRKVPLEVADYRLPSGRVLRVPTPEETLRIKGYLIVVRNQTRDYLDVAALSEWSGIEWAAGTLADIDRFYADQHQGGLGVASQLVRQLADPRPKDVKTTRHLGHYKRLHRRWHDWEVVRSVCASVSVHMMEREI